MRWWLIVSQLLALSAYAGGACSPVDLRERLGPPLNQGDSGYCFAHASSSLIQAKTGLRVSPMQLATAYILTNPEELGGAVDPEVQKLLTPQFFTMWHTDRSSDPSNYTPDRILGEEGLLDTGGDELQTLVVANYVGLCDERRLPTGADVYKKYLKKIVAYHAHRVQEGIPPEEREHPIGEVTDPDSRAMAWSYRHWVERRCGHNFKSPVPLVPTEVSLARNLKAFRRLQSLRLAADLRDDQKVIVDAIQRQLDRGNPVSIGYALSDIMPDAKAVLAKSLPPADVDHASVISGRREVNGRCYFYLRNSFGQETDGYLPIFKNRIENGGVWLLPEEIPSLYSVLWLN